MIAKRQPVDVIFWAYWDEVIEGEVLFVSERRTKVRIAFPNSDIP